MFELHKISVQTKSTISQTECLKHKNNLHQQNRTAQTGKKHLCKQKAFNSPWGGLDLVLTNVRKDKPAVPAWPHLAFPAPKKTVQPPHSEDIGTHHSHQCSIYVHMLDDKRGLISEDRTKTEMQARGKEKGKWTFVQTECGIE